MISADVTFKRPRKLPLTCAFVFLELPRIGDEIETVNENGNVEILRVTRITHRPRPSDGPRAWRLQYEHPERYRREIERVPTVRLDCALVRVIDPHEESEGDD